ncbi:MAG: hypothetical protein FJY83_11305 [Candidatus Aminicenantes bacterium]|nr:hypothetical protein [Candidatus Aminicenantes bacterium]
MLVGGISVIVFTTAVRLSFGALGLIQGTVVSVFAPLTSTIILGNVRDGEKLSYSPRFHVKNNIG